MNTTGKVALAVLGLLGVAALGGGGGGPQGSGGGGTTPQRTPTTPTAPPPSDEGEQRSNDEGRAWGTFRADRNARKHWELRVFSVAASAGDAAIGTGEVIVDVYETIVANASWQWHGAVCGGSRWRLKFSAGHLQSKSIIAAIGCATVRPLSEVLLQTMDFVQVGPNVLLIVDTRSGINKLTPDKIGTGKLGTGRFDDKEVPEWDNNLVDSGNVTLDAAWIFNKA